MKIIEELYNTYGSVYIENRGDKYVIGLSDYASVAELEISKQLYEAIVDELINKKDG